MAWWIWALTAWVVLAFVCGIWLGTALRVAARPETRRDDFEQPALLPRDADRTSA
jgi:hypothetical protein